MDAVPDTNPAIKRLTQAGYALSILSNVDDNLLVGTLRHLDVGFSLLWHRASGAAGVRVWQCTSR